MIVERFRHVTTPFVVILAVVLLLLGYAAVGMFTKASRQAAFDAISVGDSVDAVLQKFGKPSVYEEQGATFARYTQDRCVAPCSERLWFENRLFLDLEAWSVSLDSNGNVISKYHWVSP